MRVAQTVIDDFLEPYSCAARYLKEAEHLDGSIRGYFCIPQSIYLSEGVSSGHVNLVDLHICFNQLAYVSLAENLRMGSIPGVDAGAFGYFRAYRLQGMIYALDRVRMRKPICSESFSGEITISRVKKRFNTYFIRTSYSFEGSATGRVSLAMQMEDQFVTQSGQNT